MHWKMEGAPERKYIQPDKGLTVTDGRVVSGYASLFGLRDQGGDTVMKGAYAISLKAMAAAGRPMLLEGGLDWKPMGFSPSDMEFHETKQAAAREIAIAFGVPPMLIGIPGDATYANYQEANRAFFRLTVLPLASRVTAGISAWLSRFTGEQVELRPDLDQIPALAVERDQQWARVGLADFLTMDEKRVALGLPPMPVP